MVILVVFVVSVVFMKGDPNANHRFGKPWVLEIPDGRVLEIAFEKVSKKGS